MTITGLDTNREVRFVSNAYFDGICLIEFKLIVDMKFFSACVQAVDDDGSDLGSFAREKMESALPLVSGSWSLSHNMCDAC